MSSKLKINDIDNIDIRIKIDNAYKNMTPVGQAKWSISLAKHILAIAGIDYKEIKEVLEGILVNESWQMKKATIDEVRQASFKIHTLARKSKKEDEMTALRVAGHAVATGHMSEHAMVAADYAIKVINLISPNDVNAITNERLWQLNELKNYI